MSLEQSQWEDQSRPCSTEGQSINTFICFNKAKAAAVHLNTNIILKKCFRKIITFSQCLHSSCPGYLNSIHSIHSVHSFIGTRRDDPSFHGNCLKYILSCFGLCVSVCVL